MCYIAEQNLETNFGFGVTLVLKNNDLITIH